jgi:hypothetical protein
VPRNTALTEHARLFGYAEGIPYDALAHPEGPVLVPMGGWHVSVEPMDGTYYVYVSRLTSIHPRQEERHELHGAIYPTKHEATRALYEAGLLKYLVHHGTPWLNEAVEIIILNDASLPV